MKLGYVIVYVPDVKKAVAFYQKAFGLTPRFIHESGTYAELETGKVALAFASEELVSTTCPTFKPNRPTEAPAGAEIAFIVDNVQNAFEHAIEAGAQAFAQPKQKPWGQTVAYVRDLNGFLVELCTQVG